MTEMFHWCQLANGDKHTAGYIEARGAKIGAQVEMIDLDGQLWDVLSVGEAIPSEIVRKNERRFKAFQASLGGNGINQ